MISMSVRPTMEINGVKNMNGKIKILSLAFLLFFGLTTQPLSGHAAFYALTGAYGDVSALVLFSTGLVGLVVWRRKKRFE